MMLAFSLACVKQFFSDVLSMKHVTAKFVNAPGNTLLLPFEFFAKNNIMLMPQPPYLPHTASFDIFLFPKLKRTLNEQPTFCQY